MATMEWVGLEDFIKACKETDKTVEKIVGRSIYPGAKEMYSAIRHSVDALPVTVTTTIFSHRYAQRDLYPKQKQGLQESLGIARMKAKPSGLDVKLGFDGYNEIQTKKYPKGQPNMMIARSVNKGTTWLRPTYFMDRTVTANEVKVNKLIEDQFYVEMEKIWSRLK